MVTNNNNNNRRPRQIPAEAAPQHRVNREITAPTVRIVGDDIESRVCPLKEALALAVEKEMDLVEIVPTAVPPVCRIIVYSKLLYQLKRKEKAMKANSTKVVVKEIRFGPQTDDHDFNFKLKHARGFLEEGSKVRAYVYFKGRSIMFKEQGLELLKRFSDALEDVGKVESTPKMEGKRMIIIMVPVAAK